MGATNEFERGFTLTRILDAPRERVFRAWTEPRHLQWFFSDLPGPREPIELDLRVGGVWRQKMIVSEDTKYFTGGVYREIVPDEKLVFVWGASGGWPELDVERSEDGPVVTVTLDAIGDKTEMRFHLELPEHVSHERVREWLASGMREGWSQTLDRLVASFANSWLSPPQLSGSGPPLALDAGSTNSMTPLEDPWARDSLPRQGVRDDRGSIVLTHTPSTREGRPWADLAWRTPDVDAARCSDVLLSALRGWALSTEDEALATELISRGARVVRHAHGYSRDQRAAPAPSAWGSPEIPEGLRLTAVDRNAEDLAPPLLAAYPPGHPDHRGWTPEEARREIAQILSGELLGPLLPCSGLALDGQTVVGACLVTLRDGSPPHGGPWVVEVYRHPAPRYAGAGAALLRRALWLATRAKLPALSLVVSDGNPARRVYEHLGFRHVGSSRTLELPT